MADTKFGESTGSGYILINTAGGTSEAFYVSNEVSTQELLTLTIDGRLLLGERSDPEFEIRWQDRTIRFKKSWTLQSGDTSGLSDINLSANDDLQLTYGAQVGASIPELRVRKGAATVFKFDEQGQAQLYTATTAHSTINADAGIQSKGIVVCELDQAPSPNRPGVCALTATNGNKYYVWASTEGQLRVNPTVPPTTANQVSLGAAIAQVNVVGPKFAAYSASVGECVLVNPSSGIVDISLPLAGSVKNGVVTVKNASNSDNDVRILPTGGASIDDANSVVIRGHGGYATVICDGANWWVISERETI